MEQPGCLWCERPRAWGLVTTPQLSVLPPGARAGLSFLVWKIRESNTGVPNSTLPWPDKISTGLQQNEGGKKITMGAFPQSQPASV